MRLAALTTSKRLSRGKAEKKIERGAKGRPWRKKFSEIFLEGNATTVTHFTSRPVLHFFVCPSFFEFFRLFASTCMRHVRDTSRTGSTRATLVTLHGSLLEREIFEVANLFSRFFKEPPTLGMSSLFRMTKSWRVPALKAPHTVLELFLSSLSIRIESFYRKRGYSIKTIRFLKEFQILCKKCEIIVRYLRFQL